VSPWIPNTIISRHTSTLIEEIVVGVGGAATIDFSDIPQNGSLLRIIASTQSEAGETPLRVRFNADSGANYVSQTLISVGVAVTAAQEVAVTSAYIGQVNQAGSWYSNTVAEIPFYAGTSFNKSGSSVTLPVGDDFVLQFHGFGWASTAAITDLSFFPTAAVDFAAGSRIQLRLEI
jgi:hypothetical protein